MILKDPQRRPWTQSLLASLQVGIEMRVAPVLCSWRWSSRSGNSQVLLLQPCQNSLLRSVPGRLRVWACSLVPWSSRCGLPFRPPCWHSSPLSGHPLLSLLRPGCSSCSWSGFRQFRALVMSYVSLGRASLLCKIHHQSIVCTPATKLGGCKKLDQMCRGPH